MNRKNNICWGICMLLAAIVIVMWQLGAFHSLAPLNIWSIIATIALFGVIITSLVNRSWHGIFIPLALLYRLFSPIIGLPVFSVWILILVAVLLSSACYALFGRSHRSHCGFGYDGSKHIRDEQSGDDRAVNVSASFTETSKYLHASALEIADVDVSFGSLEVFFDQANASTNGLDIHVSVSFGALKLYLPKHWSVEQNVSAFLADVKERGRTVESEGAPRVRISGSVSFGDVQIIYV